MCPTISSHWEAIHQSIQNVGEAIKTTFDDVTKPLREFVDQHVMGPLKKATEDIFGTIGKVIGNILAAPFKAMEYIFAGTVGGVKIEDLRRRMEQRQGRFHFQNVF